MSDEEKEKQLIDSENVREVGVKDLETEKPAETLESVTEEVNKGVKIVKEQGKKVIEVLRVQGASPKETREFIDGEEKVEQSAEKAREEYCDSSGIIIRDNNIENREQINPSLTIDEITTKTREISNKIDNGYKKGMSVEETKELKNQRDQLSRLLPEYNEGSENKEENVGKAADLSKEVSSEEAVTLENKSSGVENKELSKEELSELEEIIKNTEAEIAFLPISTYTEKEKIDSINQQLVILGEILPKFNKAKIDELLLFRKANGLNERFLNLKENPWLLNSKNA